MANRSNTDDITIREIEYSILITDKDKGLHDLHEILKSELGRFDDNWKKRGKAENPILDFLKTNIERSIVIRDSTRVYFTDYQEKGSFSIQFRLLVVTKYLNFGTTRHALDFLVKDTIGNYFEELIERHLPASVTVHSSDNEIYDIPGNKQNSDSQKPRPGRDYLPIILASLALAFTLTLGTFWLVQRNSSDAVKNTPEDYRDKYYELLIYKQVNEALDKEKLKLLPEKNRNSLSDTTLNLKIQPRK